MAGCHAQHQWAEARQAKPAGCRVLREEGDFCRPGGAFSEQVASLKTYPLSQPVCVSQCWSQGVVHGLHVG